MAGWNLIQDVIGGARPLVRNDLWDELREAIAERMSAVECFGAVRTIPDEVDPRDPIGLTDEYQTHIASDVPKDEIGYFPVIREFDAPGGTRLWINEPKADDPPLYYIDRGIPLVDERNVFAAALGFGKTHWTHSFRDLERFVTHADIWTDMAKVLNLLLIISASVDLGTDWIVPNRLASPILQDNDWPTLRALIWNSLGADPGSFFAGGVGRIGHYASGPAPHKASGFYGAYTEKTIDLSVLWDAEHLDTTACDPVRVIFRIGYKRYDAGSTGQHENVPIKVELSGDSGATWETLRELVAVNDFAEHWITVESVDNTRWTANSILRVAYNSDPTNDTPTWDADENYYEVVRVTYDSPDTFVEFDWDYQP